MDEIIDINTLFGPLPAASADLAVDALLNLMQKHGVKAACTLSTLGLLLDSSVGNAATGAACTEHPELLPVATINPTLYFGDPAPLQKIGEEGFLMLRFFPEAQGWPVDFAPFRAMLATLRAAPLPIMVDIETPGAITTLARTVGDYPAPVILGNVSPLTLAEALAELRSHERWYIETSHLLAPGSLKLVAETVGPARLLFGTGAPTRPIASAQHTLEYAGLTDEARRQVFSGNARAILKISA